MNLTFPLLRGTDSSKMWPRIFALWVVLSFSFTTGNLLWSIETYRPDLVDPLTEQWRWLPFEMLPTVRARAMRQDESGTLWFALQNGVGRYDGQSWTHFSREEIGCNTPPFFIVPVAADRVFAITPQGAFFFNGQKWIQSNSHHISLNFVYDITHPAFLAHDGSLWITHHDGIDHIEGDGVETYRGLEEIYSTIFQERSGAVWLVSIDGTVYRCQLENGDLPPKSKWTIMRNSRNLSGEGAAFLEASNGRIWLIDSDHRSPVGIYNPSDNSWEEIDLDRLGGVNRVQSIIESHDGRIWIAGYGNLHVYDGIEWKIYQSPDYRVPEGEPILFQSQDGFLWLGEQLHFIQRVDISNRMGNTFNRLQFQCEDDAGNRWYLEYDGRVIKEDTRTNQWTAFGEGDNIISSPVAIFHASNGWIWVTGTHQGAAAINYFDGSNWHRHLHPEFATVIGHMAILETSSGDIVIGADQHPDMKLPGSGGLLRYQKIDERFESEIISVPYVPYQIPNIEETPDGSIWFGGVYLKRFDGERTNRVNSEYGETSGWIDFLIAGPDNSLWVAIWGSGALRLKNEKWDVFTEQNGLNSRLVSHLIKLDDGAICCVTDKGLYRFEHGRWTRFGFPFDFLLNRGYGTIKQTRDGSIWINQGNRAWYKRSLYSSEPTQSHQHLLTIQYVPDTDAPRTLDLQRFQHPGTPDKTTFFWGGADRWSRTPSQELLFSYRLDDSEWTPFGPQTTVTFDSLTQGRHHFEVRARDRDFNIEATATALGFAIVYPMWRQTWCAGLIIILSLSIIVLAIVMVRTRVRHIIELEEMKIDFFTNISHELRTPLSLILGPLESVTSVSAITDRARDNIKLALNSAKRLNDLINQLLDFRREDAIKREPQKQWGDLIGFTREAIRGFRYIADQKEQELVFLGQFGSCQCDFPQEAIRKVLDNLISNAIKYTPRGGRIALSIAIRTEGDSITEVTFVVEDTGPGISKDNQKLIFEPFVRARLPRAEDILGTGIGLALIKHLIDRCHGKIHLESPILTNEDAKHGTRFTVTLPLAGKVEYTPAKAPPLGEVLEPESARAKKVLMGSTDGMEFGEHSHYDHELVLVIEDNLDLAQFIKQELSDHFSVILADNGKDGLKLARQHVPDIIVTDYLLPEMDGFRLCRSIRHDRTTSHIPIIVITAFVSEEIEERGLAAGANDLLTKPFSTTALALRIRNQLEIQRRYAQSLKRHITLDLTPPEPDESRNARFIEKARTIAEEHLEDVNFTVETLAQLLGMSRTQFYRKFKAMTDVSPAALLRTLRLNRAAELLNDDELNIAEVAEMSGYSESSNFSRAFKDHFGYSPSEHGRQ